MSEDIKIKMKVKHNAADGSPGTWEPSTLILSLKASKELVERVERAITKELSE